MSFHFPPREIAEFFESKGDETYLYGDSRFCALAQFLRSKGMTDVSLGSTIGSAVYKFEYIELSIPWELDRAVCNTPTYEGMHRFSDAAKNVRRLMGEMV